MSFLAYPSLLAFSGIIPMAEFGFYAIPLAAVSLPAALSLWFLCVSLPAALSLAWFLLC